MSAVPCCMLWDYSRSYALLFKQAILEIGYCDLTKKTNELDSATSCSTVLFIHSFSQPLYDNGDKHHKETTSSTNQAQRQTHDPLIKEWVLIGNVFLREMYLNMCLKCVLNIIVISDLRIQSVKSSRSLTSKHQ